MEKKRTVINLFSLTSIQLLNYLLPLITMPYLISTVGIDNYGLLSFSQAVMQYFVLFTDYGFNILGTQEIALCKNDLKERNKTFNSILQTKLILIIGSFLLLILMIVLIPKMRKTAFLYILMFGIVLGNAIFPVWFFQGLEEMKSIGILNFIGKLIFTLGLFAFVKSPEDLYLAGALNAIGYVSVGVLSLVIVKYKYNVKLSRIHFSEIKNQLKMGWHLFIANVSTSFYTNTNVFFLGLVAGNTQTGYFNLAYTLIRACGSIAVPITQTFFPRITLLAENSREQAIEKIKKIGFVITAIFIFGCLILLFASGPILETLFPGQFTQSLELIKIMSFLPLMVAWGNIFGILLMSTFGFQKNLSKIYALGGGISLMLMLVLTLNFQGTGAAWTAFLTETLVTFMMIRFVWRKIFSKQKKV